MSEYFYKNKNITTDNGFLKNIHRSYTEDYFDKLPNVKKYITLISGGLGYHDTFYQPANTFISSIYLVTGTGTYDVSQNVGIGIHNTYSANDPGTGRNIFDGSSTNILSSGQLEPYTVYSIDSINKYSNVYRPLYLKIKFSVQTTTNTIMIYIEYKDINTGNSINNDNYYIIVKNAYSDFTGNNHGNADNRVVKDAGPAALSIVPPSRICYSSELSGNGDNAIDLITGNAKDDEIVVIPNYYYSNIRGDFKDTSSFRKYHSHHEIEWECAIGFPPSDTLLLSSSALSSNAQLKNMSFFLGLRSSLVEKNTTPTIYGGLPTDAGDICAYFAFSTSQDTYGSDNLASTSQLNFIYSNSKSDTVLYKTDLNTSNNLTIYENFIYIFKIIMTDENRIKIFIGKTNNVSDTQNIGFSIASTNIDFKQYVLNNNSSGSSGESPTTLPFTDSGSLMPFIGVKNINTDGDPADSDFKTTDYRRVMRVYYQKCSRKINSKIGLALNTKSV